EGKTLLATATALSLSQASRNPTVLIECNWQHPTLHDLFDLPPTPGIEEWLRGECDQESIRHIVSDTLVEIHAGVSRGDDLVLLERLRDRGLASLCGSDDFLVVDLPSVLSTASGRIAARLVDGLVVVAQAGVTPMPAIAETYETLCDLS